jgi:hypothetical protein
LRGAFLGIADTFDRVHSAAKMALPTGFLGMLSWQKLPCAAAIAPIYGDTIASKSVRSGAVVRDLNQFAKSWKTRAKLALLALVDRT